MTYPVGLVIYVAVAVFTWMFAALELIAGEAIAFGAFWPITIPAYLLINLYLLAKRGWRAVSP